MEASQFLTEYCAQLNDQQKAAVQAVNGATLLLAVPGSGKTTVLINRLGYMVRVCEIPPECILTMTYTVAATGEMKQRFADKFGTEYASVMEFRTINGLSEQIINYYSRNHGKRDRFRLVTDESELNKLIREIYTNVASDYPDDSTIKDLKTKITYVKNMMLDDAGIRAMDAETEYFSLIYQQYCEALRQNGQMDYDDQMKYALRILKTVEPVREYYQERFRYICVDESQDTSKIQHEIIHLLASRYNNIFMVGDEDQSIYGFRAAYPEALLQFEQNYPNARVLLMEQNYRSTEEIVRASNYFVRRNRFRREKTIRATQGQGEQVHVIPALNREAQYKYLFEFARSCSQKAAVLYRNNDSSVPLIDFFERSGIPYNCRKFDGTFFSHRVVTDFMDMILLTESPADTEAFMRLYYKFEIPISKEIASAACAKSMESGKPVLEELFEMQKKNSYIGEPVYNLIVVLNAIPKQDAATALRNLWNATGYSRYAEKKHLDKGKYPILSMLAERETSASSLLNRLQILRDLIQNHQNSSDNLITLSTIHSSKGLEYDRVFLLDVLDGVLPSITLDNDSDESDIKLYEEERRLFYVAMTRARRELYLFRCTEDAAFVAEVARHLPQLVLEDDDLFRPFQQAYCGKAYYEKERGRGVVIAQCGSILLIEFPDGELLLSDVGALFAEHRSTVTYKAAEPNKSTEISAQTTADKRLSAVKPSQRTDIGLHVGCIVTHKRFGQGRVIKLDDLKMTIRFFGEGTIKEFLREATEKKGLIVVDSQE